MAITETDIISSLQILTSVESVQSKEESEADPEENTTADLLYTEFSELLDQAEEEFENDLIRLNLATVSDLTTKRGLAYLICDYMQIGMPEWNAAKIEFNQDSRLYHFARRKGSSYYYNYLRTLENALKADADYKERRAGFFIT